MASSPLRAPAAAGQQQSRLMDMQKRFQQRHLATVAAVKGVAGSTTTSTSTTSTSDVPARRLGVGLQQRPAGGSGGIGSVVDGGDSVVQVDVKGKVRQLFAERNQQSQIQGPGYQHHQQVQRQRRRSLTGRDRSRPLRPLSDTEDDPLSKTVCFTAPSLMGGADLVGIKGSGRDVQGELLALFGRLPNLGGQLLSESFRGGSKMKTAQSAPELKWLLDSGPGVGDRGPGPPPAVAPRKVLKAPGDQAAGSKGGKGVAGGGGYDDENNEDEKQLHQQQPPAGRINSRTATVAKKPLATVNGNDAGGPIGHGRGVKKPMATLNGGGKLTGGGGGGANVPTNRLLLPPVVQPTVINALAAGAGAAAAVASVSAATAAAGAQKPLVRAARLPPAKSGHKPVAPRRQATPPSKPVAAPRQPVAAAKRSTPASAAATAPRIRSPVKSQLSADRGPPAPGMARCPLCSRDFAADRLPKHEQVCKRTRERDRKRKVFDTSRKRLEAVAAEAGVDVSSFKKKSEKEDQRAAQKLQKKKDAWRRKHDQLVRNVRAARAVQRHLAAGGSVRDLPPELENATADQDDEADSDLVKCPHCGRSFNEASAERHIPLCAERQRNAAARLQNKKR